MSQRWGGVDWGDKRMKGRNENRKEKSKDSGTIREKEKTIIIKGKGGRVVKRWDKEERENREKVIDIHVSISNVHITQIALLHTDFERCLLFI